MEKDAEKYLKSLGERIVSLRKRQGLTQVQLAEKLGTEHAQIGRLERGETNSTIIILRRIAKELGISVSELVNVD
jgi:transcriptional regulator with XRE-family HTH domain